VEEQKLRGFWERSGGGPLQRGRTGGIPEKAEGKVRATGKAEQINVLKRGQTVSGWTWSRVCKKGHEKQASNDWSREVNGKEGRKEKSKRERGRVG